MAKAAITTEVPPSPIRLVTPARTAGIGAAVLIGLIVAAMVARTTAGALSAIILALILVTSLAVILAPGGDESRYHCG